MVTEKARSAASTASSLLATARPARRTINTAVDEYIHRVKKLHLVSSLVLGANCGQRKGVLFAVFGEETTASSAKGRSYGELTKAGVDLEEALSKIIKLRVSYVNSSKVEGLERKLESQGLEVRRLTLTR